MHSCLLLVKFVTRIISAIGKGFMCTYAVYAIARQVPIANDL